MRYPDAFLEELRRAVPVIDAVGRRHKMRKAGAAEYVAVDDNSLGVNTVKNVWKDFGKGDHGGDIFEFEMFSTGCTFQEAVEALAQFAGIPLPRASGQRAKPRRANGHDDDSGPLGPEPPLDDSLGPVSSWDASSRPASSGPDSAKYRQKQIVATFDYNDVDGALRYQVCRQEWIGDDGRRKKSFLQRRPYGPVVDDQAKQPWIWGLGDGVYLRGRDGSFYSATKDRVAKWKDAERIEVEACPHILFRWGELREELAQSPNERRTIFVVEGEKDVETLVAWGCCATTNSGGAGNWRPHHAEELRGADVVVVEDHDEAGRKRGHEVALSLRGVAARVRVLRWPLHWPGCIDGADTTDWKERVGGDAAGFFEIVERLPDWSPEAPASGYGAVRFADIDRNAAPLQWTIKTVLQRASLSLWYGPPASGKSFLMTDAAMAIARGAPWYGQRTRPGLVIYQTGEGGAGFRLRLRAYRQQAKLPADEDVPFVYLPVRINLFENEAEVGKLIEEIKAWSAFYDYPLELVVIDTFNAASGGANENANQDVGRVLERCRQIVEATGAHVAVVHHTPAAGGKPRGHSSLVGDVETTIAVEPTDQLDQEENGPARTVRTWTLTKQKDGPSNVSRSFVLKRVVLGRDEDGDEVSSCVVGPLATAAAADRQVVPEGWAELNPANLDVFRALVRAIRKTGRAPAGDGVPTGERAVTVKDWQDEMLQLVIGHEELTPTVRNRIKMKIYRASARWIGGEGGRNLIVKSDEWVWRSGRKVHMIDNLGQSRRAEPEPLLAGPGDRVEDIT